MKITIQTNEILNILKSFKRVIIQVNELFLKIKSLIMPKNVI